ncbi:MFS transporter [Streptomyces malaysiensis]|uniref:MFS transporter n=1 Tax=Streptomyces malaysiensis TaxID=92644 RepID=UPI00321F8E29|nr:MFS transporter [Streptomyces malaysiensis]
MDADTRHDTTPTKNTRARGVLLALLFVITALNYLDRSNLSVAMPHIKEEFGLSATEQGLLLSSFSWAYVIAQLPAGWAVDRFGVRVSYALSILAWSLVTAATSLARGFASLLGLRMALGIAESPAYPANNKLVTTMIPSSQRARATATYLAGQYLGLTIALPFLSWLVAVAGWRSVFLVTGLMGAVAVWLWNRFGPRPAPAGESTTEASPEEERSVEAQPVDRKDVGYLLRKKRLWGLYISQFCSNGSMWFFLTWFPSYLTEQKHLDFLKAGFVGTFPYIAALCGVILSGFLSDHLLKRGMSRTWARKLPIMVGFALCGVIVTANYTDSVPLVITIMSVAFFAQGLAAIGWTLASEIAPVRMMGLAGGVFNFFTNLGGAVVPVVIGVILDATGSFNGALAFVSLLSILGLLSYALLIDRVERLDPDAEAASAGPAGPGGGTE